jgi:beta-galactosidase
MCGFPKDSFHLHKAFFTSEPFVHLFPHWNWPGKEGQSIRVMACTNCAVVELFLNGQSLGKKDVDPIEMVQWMVPYAPGVLRAVASNGEFALVQATIQTTAEPIAVGLELDPAAQPEAILADGQCALPVTAFATDSEGHRVPTADDFITFSITGPASILGVGNGDPNCHEPDKGSARSLFQSLAQVIIRTTAEAGIFTLHASAPGLRPASLELQSLPAQSLKIVPSAQPRYFLEGWRMSPIVPDRPDPHQTIAEQDMNTWESINPANGPQKQWQQSQGYALYRTTVKLPQSMQTLGGRIVFEQIIGSVQFYIGRDLIASSQSPIPGSTELIVPASSEKLVIYSDAFPAGLAGAVELLGSD